MRKTPWFSELTEAQVQAALDFAADHSLPIETGGDVRPGEFYARVLNEPEGVQWTDELVEQFEAVLVNAG